MSESSDESQIDAFTFATFINTLNAVLADALNPYYGLFDNIMTNISFQMWPLFFGTHYGRVCHLNLSTCSRPVHEEVPHTAS